jgi:RNA polymerase sigma-70 factor (ECF subfamily)
MRRFSGDDTLADDLAQQVFLQAWRDIAGIREPKWFGAWLKRLTLNIWLKHQRVNDPLRGAGEDTQPDLVSRDSPDINMDLERALATLSNIVRLCVVLSYHEGMSHGEIAKLLELPLGTVKSHIRRATGQLREMLSAYSGSPGEQQ